MPVSLRERVIRLAKENPGEVRGAVLSLLKKAQEDDVVFLLNKTEMDTWRPIVSSPAGVKLGLGYVSGGKRNSGSCPPGKAGAVKKLLDAAENFGYKGASSILDKMKKAEAKMGKKAWEEDEEMEVDDDSYMPRELYPTAVAMLGGIRDFLSKQPWALGGREAKVSSALDQASIKARTACGREMKLARRGARKQTEALFKRLMSDLQAFSR